MIKKILIVFIIFFISSCLRDNYRVFGGISTDIKDENQIKEIEKSVLDFRSDYLKDSFVFDFFYNEKNNEYKIGFRFIFQSNYKTLEDKDVDSEIKNIVNIIYSNKNVEIPGMKDDNY